MAAVRVRLGVSAEHRCDLTGISGKVNTLAICSAALCRLRWVLRRSGWVRFRPYHLIARLRYGLLLRGVGRQL